MNIIGVILNKLMTSKCVSTSVMTLEEFRIESTKYTKSTIVVKIDDDSYLFIDALKLFTELPLTIERQSTSSAESSDNSTDTTETIRVETWEQLIEYLSNLEMDFFQKYFTTSIVPRTWEYKSGEYALTPFYSNTSSQLRIRSIENSFGFDVEYCDHNDFYERRNLGKSWNYPDISIINTGVDKSINFHNCIPIVNGAAFYPEVRVNDETGHEELIAHEAGKWLITSDWNQGNVKTARHHKIVQNNEIIIDEYKGGEPATESAHCYNKNIVLLDFTPFGDISVIKLSDCLNSTIEYDYNDITEDDIEITDKKANIHTAYVKGNVKYPKCSYYTIKFDLPVGTRIGIPIVCICGRLFYLHEDSEISVSDDKISLTVKIDREMFNQILLSNLQWFGKQNIGTGFVEEYANLTLDELFKDTEYGTGSSDDINRKLHEDNSVPYVVMIHTDKSLFCTKTEPIMKIGPDKFLFPPNAGGILVNKRTREIVDYVRQFYASGTLIETCMLRPINYITKDVMQLTKQALSFEFNKYKSKSKYETFDNYEEGRDLDEYILLDFAYTENINGSEQTLN